MEKAKAAGIAAPEPGPEPKLDDILAEAARNDLFKIIEDLVLWENTTNEEVLQKARDAIWESWRQDGRWRRDLADRLTAAAGGDRGAAPPRDLRARPRPDRRSRRSSPGRLSERVDHRDQPRAAAGVRRATLRGAGALDVRRRRAGCRSLRGTSVGRDPAVRPRSRRADEHRQDRPSSRRAAAGDRAGGGALAHARRGRGRGRPRSTLRAAVGRYGTSTRDASLAAAVSCSDESLEAEFAEVRRPLGVRWSFHRRGRSSDLRDRCSAGGHGARSTGRTFAHGRVGGRRFALLETLRAFGVERLLVEGRAEEARGRHARHYVDGSRTPSAGCWTPSTRSPRSTPPFPSCAWRSAG